MKFTLRGVLFSLGLLAVAVSAAPQDLTERYHPPTCPTCHPLPGQNKCDITTSCIGVQHYGAPYYCACRHGYRASHAHPGDTSIQFRLDWPGQEGRVFVKPGTACDKLCDKWELGKDGCKEVELVSECRANYHH